LAIGRVSETKQMKKTDFSFDGGKKWGTKKGIPWMP
jgi:hypothetical protein